MIELAGVQVWTVFKTPRGCFPRGVLPPSPTPPSKYFPIRLEIARYVATGAVVLLLLSLALDKGLPFRLNSQGRVGSGREGERSGVTVEEKEEGKKERKVEIHSAGLCGRGCCPREIADASGY